MERRNTVLRKMHEAGFIDKATYSRAVQTTLAIAPFKTYEKRTGYFTEYVKQVLEEYVEHAQDVFTSGFNVKTTMSLKMVQYAYEAIEKGMGRYKKRHPGVKELPEVALVAMEVKTGELKVLVGAISPSLHTTGPFRPKGSPAPPSSPSSISRRWNKGSSPAPSSRIHRFPTMNPYTGVVWNPGTTATTITVTSPCAKPLELSLNTATIRLLEQKRSRECHRHGQTAPHNEQVRAESFLALGTTEVAPIEIAAAYAAFARGGAYVQPISVKAITTMDGEERYREEAAEEPIVTPRPPTPSLIS